MQQLLNMCTKEMHFSFNGELYKQINGVAMGSPLGPVIANICMVKLEKSLVPNLTEIMPLWFRYVDDTFTFIKTGEIENVKNILNNFHQDIKFTHEVEENKSISFLDVKITRNEEGSFITEVSRKESDTNIYLHWKSFAPIGWKIGTLKGLCRRAYMICSEKSGLEKELNHLKFVFTKINGFPSKIVHKTLYQVKKTIEQESNLRLPTTSNVDNNINQNSTNCEEVHPYIVLPFKGKEGGNILYGLKKQLKKFLPSNVKPRFSYNGKKLGSFFTTKDKVKTEHQTDLVYGYSRGYVGETSVRYGKRTFEHSVDKNSSIFKDAIANNYKVVDSDFKILAKGFSKTRDRKLAEALFIKELKPRLN